MKEKIAVLGAGSWGSVLASVLTQNGYNVSLWSNSERQVIEMNKYHTNKKFINDYVFPDSLYTTTSLNEVLENADYILFVVPTKYVRNTAKKVFNVLSNLEENKRPILIHATKGLESNSYKRISEVILEEIDDEYHSGIVVLSGPSHAEEVARKDITLITAASLDISNAKKVQNIFMNEYLRIYTNSDVIGVEVGAAFKNIIAIGAGILHGLNYGDDAKAALITRGLAEITRLGTALGANPLTFMGLSGVGDLIVTCTSIYSRNWRCGDQLGQGKKIEEIIKNMGMVIEGINTCKAAYNLSLKLKLSLPICNAMYDVLYHGVDIPSKINDLMIRPGKSEIEGYNL